MYKTCYPPTVNYDPRYYLINGVAFDRTNPTLSTQAILGSSGSPGAVGNGAVLLRLVNAGLRMHVPSVVGRNMTLYAEDGNPLPGVPRVQSEVFMAAGKTYDVGISPTQGGTNYAPQTYAVYDRQLSLSTNNQRDGGMIAYVNVAGATTGGGTAAAAAAVTANADSYYLVSGNGLSVADPLKGVIANDVGVYGVSVLVPPTGGTLTLNAGRNLHLHPGDGNDERLVHLLRQRAGRERGLRRQIGHGDAGRVHRTVQGPGTHRQSRQLRQQRVDVPQDRLARRAGERYRSIGIAADGRRDDGQCTGELRSDRYTAAGWLVRGLGDDGWPANLYLQREEFAGHAEQPRDGDAELPGRQQSGSPRGRRQGVRRQSD